MKPLTHLMTYEELVGRKNEFKEVPEEYEAAFKVWVSLEPLSQTERLRAAAVDVITTHRVVMHYIPTVKASGRFRYGDRIFDIVDVINVGERNTELNLTVAEHGA